MAKPPCRAAGHAASGAGGRLLTVSLTTSPVSHGGAVVGTVTVALEVTEQVRRESLLRHLAEHDDLTLLYSRRRFDQELRRAVAQCWRYRGRLSLLLLDLDGLKQCNDTFGHAAGDELLRAAASELTLHTRASDLPARLGGDEFAIILPQTALEHAKAVAERILVGMSRRGALLLPDRAPLKASIGVAELFGEQSPAQLLDTADRAMYRAKRAGGSQIACAERTLDPGATLTRDVT